MVPRLAVCHLHAQPRGASGVRAGHGLDGKGQVSARTWEPPANGISLDPYDTVTAVLWCATRATSLRNGLVSAVQLGGDTDTVAALVGGLMGGKLTAEQVRAELPWHRLVVLPEPESAIAETAAALAATRAIQSVWGPAA
jgi:ADP-ribosylglycohydrolase